MTYQQFRTRTRHLTEEQLRCDVPPTQEILDLIEEVGAGRYEQFVSRLTAQRRAVLTTPDYIP